METAEATQFRGHVLLDGETGNGLDAFFAVDEKTIRLVAADEELGTWSQSNCEVSPSGKGAFLMVLDGESVTFKPESPSAFAEAMSVPIAPDPVAEESKPKKYDYDAAIDEAIANATAMHGDDKQSDMLSKPVVVGIASISGALMVSLVTFSMVL